MRQFSWRIPLAALALTACVLAACESRPRPGPPATDIQARISAALPPALRGTVGEFSALADGAPVKVEGWGIVGGLPHTGSPDMDSRLHDLMLNKLLTIGVGTYSAGLEHVRPEDILASDQMSVVEVRGIIPPLARKGSTFDLYINAVPGTGTTSLANGLLWPSDLKQLGLTFEGNDSRTIASGQGAVFIPGPLEALARQANGQPAADAPRALRSGRVIAGGVCAEDRDSRLQTYVPDWMRTRLIERTINAHFASGRDKAATAENAGTISLHIPPEYRDNPMEFVDMARHLYLTTDEPGFVETKAAELIAALKDPTTPHRDLGLALEGLGRSILPGYLQPNYTSGDAEVRFWCARAGAALQDAEGLATLEEMVRNPGNPLRREALLAMIDVSRGRDTTRVSQSLYEMVRSDNTEDRILAYRALQTLRSRYVLTYKPGRNMLLLDVVTADSAPMIYMMESASPRIAFIGREIKLPAGSTFISKDKLLSVFSDVPGQEPPAGRPPLLVPASAPDKNKSTEPDTVNLLWRGLMGDKVVQLRSAASLPKLVARTCWIPDPLAADYDKDAPFIGLSYQRIAETLAQMCADGTIDATFVVERTPDALLNPTDLALAGRAEGLSATTRPAATAPTTQAATRAGPAR